MSPGLITYQFFLLLFISWLRAMRLNWSMNGEHEMDGVKKYIESIMLGTNVIMLLFMNTLVYG